MRRIIFLCLLLPVISEAATKFWVTFTDKAGTPYSISNPSAFLSLRSIQRRANQGIPVTADDLPVNPSYVTQVLATGAVTLNYTSRWFNAISITTSDAGALTAIAALPFVSGVNPVFRMRRDDGFSELDFNGTLRSAPELPPVPMAYNYGSSYNQINQVNGVCLHNMGYHGEGMRIAVLDDGFMNVNTIAAFDSIRINNQILGTKDFANPGGNVYSVGGHGTMVLSCMAAFVNNQIVGTAPKAEYYLIRTEDAVTEYLVEEDNWVAGAEYADSAGADIICTSLYYTQFDDASQNHTFLDMDGQTTICARAANFTARVGMLTFCCAGNSGQTAWLRIGTPSDADSAFAVGAVNGSGNLASFSSRGPSADGQVKPDICAQGVSAVVVNSGGNLTTANGTSFSTPICAGAAACLWQYRPSFTNMQIRSAIWASSSQYLSPDSLKGYGIPDFCLAGMLVTNQEEVKDPGMFIFPNPADENLFVLLKGFSGAEHLQILDPAGRVVLERDLQSPLTSLDISLIPPGFYFVSCGNRVHIFIKTN
ncbi:MAG: S8 family serine peptidase [Bacteroidia bacterium]|nr:S8 family serine peptidase [Bacteroidia bacterium]